MDNKKILIVGVGVQGSTVAKCIDKDPLVSEIICADRDEKAVNELVAVLTKGKAAIIDASDQKNVAEAAKGVDLIVNALPGPVMMPTLNASVEAKVNYLDFITPIHDFIGDHGGSIEDMIGNVHGDFFDKYDKIFKETGKTHISGVGGAPGLSNVMARYTVRFLDTCDTIKLFLNEGLRTNHFIPFWWSPAIALACMNIPGLAFMDGKVTFTVPYSGALYRSWPELGREEIFYEHGHTEPVSIGYCSDEFYKGVKNVFFKYAGGGMDFAKPLYDIGLLSTEPEEVEGGKVVPFDLVLKHLPPAPKYKDEIKAIIDEGIKEENGAMVIEATGTKNGKKVLVETHVFSPGIEETFEKMGISTEMYGTGMTGAIFTRMLLEGKIARNGVITGDTLADDEIDCFLEYAVEAGYKLEVIIKDPIEEEHNVIPISSEDLNMNLEEIY